MTPLQREALQMCLEYIETDAHERRHVRWKINEALAEPQQEPIETYIHEFTKHPHPGDFGIPKGHWWQAKNYAEQLCASQPPQRKPLTDEQVLDCWKQAYEPGRREHDNATRMARAIEAAHGIKGEE